MDIIIPGLQVLIAFQCILFGIYLVLGGKLIVLANRINFGLLLLLAVHMGFNLVNQHLYVGILPNLSFGFGLFYGPLIYFYIKALTYRSFVWTTWRWLHFFPGLVFSLAPLWLYLPALLGALATFVSMGVYLAMAYRSFLRFQRVLAHTQSAQDRIAMRWAAHILILNAAGLALNILSVGLYLTTGSNVLAGWAEIGLFLVLLAVVNAFVFKGLLQPEIFAGITNEDEAIANQSAQPAASTELDEARRQQIRTNLLSHMALNKPYLDPLFSLQALGRQLGETPRYVSIVINSHLGLNFSDFVNGYRINDIKTRLLDPSEQRTILEIVFACGFSTKSNFNRAFKQAEGMTPSEFRKSHASAPSAG